MSETLESGAVPIGAVEKQALRATPYVVSDWQSAAFATAPADRARAEAGITAAYAAAGLGAPERFVWVPSPAHGAVASVMVGAHGDARIRSELSDRVGADLDGAGANVRHAVWNLPWERERTAASAELGARRWAAAWAETGGLLWEPVNGLVARVREAIGRLSKRERSGGESLLRSATLDAVLGQHDAPWLALFESLGRLDGDLAGPAEAARSAGWWWPYERLVIVSERPNALYRDEPGRLHRGDGPALAYPGGLELDAWHGMPVPAGFVKGLSRMSAERLLGRIADEPNAELRRVMLEVFGHDRYLAETGARPVHQDETGVLWRIELPDDEPVTLVEVVNSTPEPDGSSRTYHLRVPPTVRTAREGVAWTFGVSEADYHPERQT